MPTPGPPQPPAPPTPGERAEHDPPVVEVTVTSVGEREVEVRLADGRTGVMPRPDFDKVDPPPEQGDTIRAAVLARDDPRGRVAMSAAWAAKSDAWRAIDEAREAKRTLSGQVAQQVKGGLVVDLGIRAFLPRSLVGDVADGLASLVGSTVDVVVHEVDRAADRLVVSRRDAMRREHRAAEKKEWGELEVGQRRTGKVVAIEDYGAKVSLGVLQGLVHRSELSWSHIDVPGDVVAVGDEVDVVVLDVSRSRRRIGLSMRQAAPHPFDAVEVGTVYRGTVQRVVDYGAFVRLDDSGAEGLVHMSELSAVPGTRPDQVVAPGEDLRVKVLSTDRDRNRMALSALQAALEG